MARNERTSAKAGSAAGKLQALIRKGGEFWWYAHASKKVRGGRVTEARHVTELVHAVAGSTLTQRPDRKPKARARRRR